MAGDPAPSATGHHKHAQVGLDVNLSKVRPRSFLNTSCYSYIMHAALLHICASIASFELVAAVQWALH